MFDFTFHNPTKIIFGRNKEQEIGVELNAAGIKKVLFVHGRESIKRSGLYDRVTSSLRAEGITFHELAGVSPNPRLSHVAQGIALVRERPVDAVLAVGGGSVLDEAKAIAVGSRTDQNLWGFFLGKAEISAALPVYTVLTLAATGSEMNGNCVITNKETCQKYSISSPRIYPRVSILNPELTFSVPPDHTAYGAVDVITHVLEGYFTKQPSTRLQDRLVESIIKSVITTTGSILAVPTDYQARAEFMWAATLALNGLTPAGIGEYNFPSHMIEHALSALYDIPHGAGLAIVLPAWMKWYSRSRPEQFDRFARVLFNGKTGAEGIAALEDWFVTIKVPTRLGDVDIPAEAIGKIAENAAGLAGIWGMGDEYPASTIAEILEPAI